MFMFNVSNVKYKNRKIHEIWVVGVLDYKIEK